MRLRALLLVALIGAAFAAPPSCVVQVGTDIPPATSNRLRGYLTPYGCVQLPANATKSPVSTLPPNSVVLLLGNGSLSAALISPNEISALGPEAYILRSAQLQGSIFVYAAVGSAVAPALTPDGRTPTGSAFGAYALLAHFGFAFLQPFQPLSPQSLAPLTVTLNITETPRWPFRGTHYHTEHPLELNEFFNGFDSVDAAWDEMVPQYEGLLEWLVASGQNRLEISLLYAADWADFAYSPVRQARFANISATAAAYGITFGADAGIAIKQQHAMYMVSDPNNNATAEAEIRRTVDYLVGGGFHYFSCESGYSEFTHPVDTVMLGLMNYLTSYLADTYNKTVWIKCHCSQGQYCEHYEDPNTGKPLNFNFLPYYADPRLAIFPHTVQYYTFDDPAWTYGNDNFSFMFDFIFDNIGKRDVVYHGESAYWCNYDIDVPLFLPLYGYARVYDLRKIALEENARNVRMDGYMDFNSGFEWGYWLNSLIAARAAWAPGDTAPDAATAFSEVLSYVLTPFGASAAPLASFLTAFVDSQRALMIYGNLTGGAASSVSTNRRNGQGYVEGWDTWSTLGSLTNGQTQPLRVGLEEIRLPFRPGPSTSDVLALLGALDASLNASYAALAAAVASVPAPLAPLAQELLDTLLISSLRATQIHALYDYASSWAQGSSPWRQARLAVAEDMIAAAAVAVSRREAAYRVPAARIGAWRENPTAYDYTYLWTVHSLFYFWRDYGQALDTKLRDLTPCYMNIINPLDVGFGEGIFLNVTAALIEYFNSTDPQLWTECMLPPAKEPVYPNDTLH